MTNDASVEAVLKKHLRISIDQDWDGMKYAILGIDEAAAELAALSPPPTVGASHIANCCQCGRIIDTREKAEGGDDWGHQLSDQLWVCSPECLDAVSGEPPTVGAEDEAVAWATVRGGAILAVSLNKCQFNSTPLYTRPAPAADGQRVKAIKAALEWDERRNYIMPYRVRDPLRACLATDKEGA